MADTYDDTNRGAAFTPFPTQQMILQGKLNVEGNDKKRERLNCIEHILSKIPYHEIPHDLVELPQRVFNPDYERRVLPDELYVPKVY